MMDFQKDLRKDLRRFSSSYVIIPKVFDLKLESDSLFILLSIVILVLICNGSLIDTHFVSS